jgi:hypothetical protein
MGVLRIFNAPLRTSKSHDMMLCAWLILMSRRFWKVLPSSYSDALDREDADPEDVLWADKDFVLVRFSGLPLLAP